jgi:O-antigen/teichoic acid export membrane protein
MAEKNSHSFKELLIWGEFRNQAISLVTLGISTLSSFIVIAALSVYQFGLYQLILTAVGFASLFASGFFDDLMINEVARSFADGRRSTAKRLFNEYFWGKVAISLIATAVLFFGAELVARHYDKDISSYIRIASFLVAIGIIRTSQSLFFRSIVSFSAFGANAIYEAMRLVALAAFWFTTDLSLTTILGVSVAAAAVTLLYSSFFFIRRYREAFKDVRAESAWLSPKIILSQGRWLMLRQGVSRMTTGLDTWYVRFFLNTEAVGFYAFARTLLTILQGFIPTSMLGVLLPWELGVEGRLRFIYRRMTKYGIWIGLAIALVAFFTVPPFIGILFPKYNPALPLFRLIVWTLPFYAVYKFQKSFLITLREQELLAKRYLSELLVNAGIAVTLLPAIGLFAIAVEFFVDYIGRVWLYAYYLRKRYPYLSLSWRGFVRFDEDDRKVFHRILEEVFSPRRWFRPARSRVNIPR